MIEVELKFEIAPDARAMNSLFPGIRSSTDEKNTRKSIFPQCVLKAIQVSDVQGRD